MLCFIIFDDDVKHNINTEKGLKFVFKKYNIEAEIALNTTKACDVIEYGLKNKEKNNVYMLDVDVHGSMNGIEVAAHIREQDARAYIVFISGHPEYVMPSLKTKVFDYLIKPISIEILENCIVSIHKDFTKVNPVSEKPLLKIKSGHNIYALNFNEILFFEKYGHVLIIHTISAEIQGSESLDSIECKLDKNEFFRCHKSIIINISNVSRVDYSNNLVYLKNGKTCPVSKRSKKELKAVLEGA